jgi:hypothetical protein
MIASTSKTLAKFLCGRFAGVDENPSTSFDFASVSGTPRAESSQGPLFGMAD